jgi:Mg-chelatase subunit ChlD
MRRHLRSIGVAVLLAGSGACGSRSGLLGAGSEDREAVEPIAQAQAASLEPLPADVLPPAEPERTGCVDITRQYDSAPATVLLLVDQSGSMRGRFGGGRRWDVLRDAIVDPDDGLLQWLDGSSRVGLMTFTSLDGFAGGACPMIVRADARVGAAERLRRVYLSESALVDGDTPTGEAIDVAVSYLQSLPPLGPSYILLLTDGDPDTCVQPDPNGETATAVAVAAARAAFDAGIRLQVVGVSDDISPDKLQRMANAGAGKDERLRFGTDQGAQQPFYASSDPRELAQQLRGVIGDERTCLVDLETFVGLERAGEGSFVLDGVTLRHGAPDGWTFVDDDIVQIHGASCDQILGEGERLEVTFPCAEGEPVFRDPR